MSPKPFLILLLFAGALAPLAWAQPPPVARPAEEPALRELAAQFYSAYGKRDLDAFMALWSEASPDYAARQVHTRQMFDRPGLVVSEVKIGGVEVVDGDAVVRTRVTFGGLDAQLAGAPFHLSRPDRALRCVRLEQGWRVLREFPDAAALTTDLLAASGPDAQQALLERKEPPVTPELAEELLWQRLTLLPNQPPSHARVVCELAVRIAGAVDDRAVRVETLRRLGSVLQQQQDFPGASRALQEALGLSDALGDPRATSAVLRPLARVRLAGGDRQGSLDAAERAVRLALEARDPFSHAAALRELGDIRRQQGNLQGAADSFRESLARFEELKSQRGVAFVLNSLANVQLGDPKQHAEALRGLERALALLQALDDRRNQAVVHLTTGNLMGRMGRPEDALAAYTRAGDLYHGVGDRAREADAHYSASGVHAARGRLPEAATAARQAFEAASAAGDRRRMAVSIKQLAMMQHNQRMNPEALATYQQALELESQLGMLPQAMNTLDNISLLQLFRLGQPRAAMESARHGLALAEKLGNPVLQAQWWYRIGNVYGEIDDVEQLLASWRRALELARTGGNVQETVFYLVVLGNVLDQRGNYRLALTYAQEGVTLSRNARDPRSQAEALRLTGRIYHDLNNHRQALHFFEEARKLCQEAGDRPGAARLLVDLGDACRHLKRTVEAQQHLQEALDNAKVMARPDAIAGALTQLGALSSESGNHDAALRYHTQALQIQERGRQPNGAVTSLTNLGATYAELGRWSEALAHLNRAQEWCERVGVDRLADVYTRIGAVHHKQGHTIEAMSAYRRAAALLHADRVQLAGDQAVEQQYLAGAPNPHEALAHLLAKEDKLEEALSWLERARGRVLSRAVQNNRRTSMAALTAEERAKEQELRATVVRSNSRLTAAIQQESDDEQALKLLREQQEEARLAYEAFLTQLYVAHPELKVARGAAAPLTLAEAASLVRGQGSALLEYLVGPEDSSLFVITASPPSSATARAGSAKQPPVTVRVYSLPVGGKELEKQVDEFRQVVADPSRGPAAAARRLYDLLLKPAERQLQGKTRLVIVPDDALWELPFQALQPRAGRYLAEERTLSYVSSLTVLREMQRRKRITSAAASLAGAELWLLAVGNPVLGGQVVEQVKALRGSARLGALPAAEAEVKELARLYGAKQSRVLIGEAATEEQVRAQIRDARILHFATHGVADDTSPMYSHLMLARPGEDSKEDGLLEAWELLDLPLKADLAVLSACDTARGEVSGGEGIIGLTWAFFLAGCPTVVASQWPVESSGTSKLMVEFHRQLRATAAAKKPASRIGTAEALRRAQGALLRTTEYRHPFYWAAFAVYGNAN